VSRAGGIPAAHGREDVKAPDPIPFTELPDLAVRTLGGSVVYANDELYAERENLITAAPAVFAPATFGLKGQVYDGWETRRRREPGHDHAIVRLGAAGIIHGVVVDTSFFTGNYPPEVSVEATGAEGFPSPADLAGTDWVTLVPRSPAKGDARNTFEVSNPHRYTHVRLSIFPDGGVARLRVHGEVVPDPRFLAGTLDLAAAENGGTITGCSDMFYSSAAHLIAPGRARTMGEGWENARRRDDGNDWVSVRLALAGRIRHAELDTSLFVGNAPGWAQLSGTGAGAGPGVVRPAAPDPAAARHPAPLPARAQAGRGRGPAGRLSRRRDGPAPAVGRGRSGRAPGGRRPLARRPAPGTGGHRAGRGRAPGGPRDRHRRRGGRPLGHAASAGPGRADPLVRSYG
jgi:allantoicase